MRVPDYQLIGQNAFPDFRESILRNLLTVKALYFTATTRR